jgi:small subunit ribosomal protein S4
MSRYTGPKVRLIRKFGRLDAITRKKGVLKSPGQHGRKRRGEQDTEYAQRLKEKQKVRFSYGVTEQQLVNYVKEALRTAGETGSILLQFLEMRLDNVIYRLGMAPTIFAARQLVNHRHICVNGRRVSIPSYQCRPGDELAVWTGDNDQKSISIISQIRLSLELKRKQLPQRVVRFDQDRLQACIVRVISRDLVGLEVDELAVLEFYSRKI